MSIIDQDGNKLLKMSFVWKIGAMALIGLVTAQTGLLFTWGIWITSEVQKNKTDIAVIQSGISNIKSGLHGISSQVGKLPSQVALKLNEQLGCEQP